MGSYPITGLLNRPPQVVGAWEEQGEVSSAVEEGRDLGRGRPEGGWAGVSKGRKGPEERDGVEDGCGALIMEKRWSYRG